MAPKFGLELGAAVCSDGFRGAEAGDPGIEGLGDCRCGDVTEGLASGHLVKRSIIVRM